MHFLELNCGVSDKVPFKYVPGVPLTITLSTLLHRRGGNPLPETMLTMFYRAIWRSHATMHRNPVMMTSSNGNIFRVTGHLCEEFTGYRWIPHTKARDAELWCFLWSARLSKQLWGWWFETPSRPLWRHCNLVAKHYAWCNMAYPKNTCDVILRNSELT